MFGVSSCGVGSCGSPGVSVNGERKPSAAGDVGVFEFDIPPEVLLPDVSCAERNTSAASSQLTTMLRVPASEAGTLFSRGASSSNAVCRTAESTCNELGRTNLNPFAACFDSVAAVALIVDLAAACLTANLATGSVLSLRPLRQTRSDA